MQPTNLMRRELKVAKPYFCSLAILLTLFCHLEAWAMQRLHWNGREINGWICAANELKPKTGANSHNTWILAGNEIRPKAGATASNTWIKTGDEIRPKTGATASNTWVLHGSTLRPKTGANQSNTWDVGSAPLLVIVGKIILRLF